jgi:hypothetical protein
MSAYNERYAPKSGKQVELPSAAPPANRTPPVAPNEPVTKFSVRGGIQVSVWMNPAKNSKGEIYPRPSVNIQKSYKDEDGNYQKTNSLSINDIPRVICALQDAYEYLISYKDASKDVLED